MGIVAMQGAGVEEEVVTSVAVEEEDTTVPSLICSKMLEVTTKKLLLEVMTKKLLLKAVVLLHIIALCFLHKLTKFAFGFVPLWLTNRFNGSVVGGMRCLIAVQPILHLVY